MFTSILLACLAVSPQHCIEIIDERGPYKTRRECEIRIDEMIIDSVKIFNEKNLPFVITSWKCDDSGAV